VLKKLGLALLNLTNVGRDDVAPRFELSFCRNSRSFTYLLSWDDVVGIVPRLRVERSGVRIPVGPSDFFFFCTPERSDRLWGQPSILFSGYRCFFPEVNRPMREGDHLPPSGAEVENDWSYASTPFICLHGVDRKKCLPFVYAFLPVRHTGPQIARMLQVVRRW